jgi:hypothetical protein
LIANGLRWRDAPSPECGWEDVWAVVRTQSWDSPLSKAMKPAEWYWHDPQYPVLMQMRDVLRVLTVKTPMPKGLSKDKLPKPTLPPWVEDRSREKFAPNPVTKDEIDAHLERLNGRR